MKKPLHILLLSVAAFLTLSVVSSLIRTGLAESEDHTSSTENTSSIHTSAVSVKPEITTAVSLVSEPGASSSEKVSAISKASAVSMVSSKVAISSRSSAVVTSTASAPMVSSIPHSQTTVSEITSAAASSAPVSVISAVSVLPASSVSSQAAAFASEVVRLLNIERAKAGISALTESTALNAAAGIRANEILLSFSHTRPDGREWYTVLNDSGITFSAAGENIAAGQKTPAEVVEGWMNSAGHKSNIMNPNFNKVGVGYVTGGEYGTYWSQLFTN